MSKVIKKSQILQVQLKNLMDLSRLLKMEKQVTLQKVDREMES